MLKRLVFGVAGLALVVGCANATKQPAAPAPQASSSSPPPASSASASAPPSAAPDPNVEAAKAASEKWLALVDGEKYTDSWNEAATAFKAEVTAQHWASAVDGVRRPLGKLSSRQLRSAEYKTSLPGVADGQYVVIQLDSVFEHKAQAVETVTVSREPDGTWRVSGYFIK